MSDKKDKKDKKDKDKKQDKVKDDKKDKGKDDKKDKKQDKVKDDKKDKGKDKGGDKASKKADKERLKQEKKQKKTKLTKEDKKQKKDKHEKMSKEQRKEWKNKKVEKKKERKTDLVTEVDVYDPVNIQPIQHKIDAGANKQQSLVELANAGQTPGLQIWRIEQFNLVPWPQDRKGQFYEGDSYVVLHTQQLAGGVMQYDLYFWIGELSSQDEYGAAAVWTVNIDDKLQGKATQNREVQDYESADFLALFSPGIQILQGGVESGFNKVDRDAHTVRLLKVKGTKENVRIMQVLAESLSLNSGDVFILDTLNTIFVWVGKQASQNEVRKGNELATSFKAQRGSKPNVIHVDEGEDNAEFWEALGGKGPILTAEEGGSDMDAEKDRSTVKSLWKLSDASGQEQFNQVATGKISKSMLDSNDAFIFDTGFEIFVWVGKAASPTEKKQALAYAQRYLVQHNKPAYLPISKIPEGGHHPTFESQFN